MGSLLMKVIQINIALHYLSEMTIMIQGCYVGGVLQSTKPGVVWNKVVDATENKQRTTGA